MHAHFRGWLLMSALVATGCGAFVRGETDAGSAVDRPTLVVTGAAPRLLHLNLLWRTPGDPDEPTPPGSDLDLHLRHESGAAWNVAPGDCHPNNRHPDWGLEGENSDNPRHDRDAIGDGGPENINLDAPELDVFYSVGVHYVADEGFGPSTAHVVLRVDGEEIATFADLTVAVPEDFVHVADFRWSTSGFELWERRESSTLPLGF